MLPPSIQYSKKKVNIFSRACQVGIEEAQLEFSKLQLAEIEEHADQNLVKDITQPYCWTQ